MKRVFALLTVATMSLFVFAGCAGGIKLEENQMEFIFDKDGGITMRGNMEDKEFEDGFDTDFDDKKADIMEDMEDYIEDYMTDDYEIKNLKLNKDTAEFEIYFEDAGDMYMEIKDTLEDYADDYYDVDMDELEEYEDFVFFKDGEDVDGKDLEDYADFLYIEVYGDEEGTYYTFPSKIQILSDKMDFEKINNNTVFIEDGEYGMIVIEEF